MSLRWHFPTADFGETDGLNDPLREYFEGDHERYIARESIQNSLDARKDFNLPVKVRFELFHLQTENIPGLSQLTDIMKRGKEFSKNQENSATFYGNAIELLKQTAVPVLKISDFNTTGLTGDEDNDSGGWYKLICASGVNSMTGDGGGSFGIGKGAPFAASSLRTVYYSTLNEDGNYSMQGKARLSSFKNSDGDKRRGAGLFGLDKDMKQVVAISDQSSLHEVFGRSEQGTDIYIIGYQALEEDWTKSLLNSLLNNFWAAMYFGDLAVELYEDGNELHCVSTNSLGEYMLEYASEKGESHDFYRAVSEPTEVRKAKLPGLKDVSLYIKVGENYPKSVQMMRKPRMVVYTINNYRVLPEPYAAVFICESEVGNRLLRQLEPPAHDKWDPDRDKINGRIIVKEYQDWIRDSLRSMATDDESEPDDIPELSTWLPNEEDRDDESPYLGNEGEPANNEIESADEKGTEQEPAKPSRPEFKRRIAPVVSGFAKGEGGGKRFGKGGGSGGTKINPDESGLIQRISPDMISFKAREVSRNGLRYYQIVINAKEDVEGAVKIVAIGDDHNYPLQLEEVEDEHGNAFSIKDACIRGIRLDANESVKLFIKLHRARRYAIGVE
jgi:hypothetical protein